MKVPTARPRVLAGGSRRLGRPSTIAVALAASATALVALAPGFVLEQSLRVVSTVHPDVTVSIDGADVGWLTSKPRFGRVAVTDKRTKTVLFQCAGIKASASLLDVIFRRYKGEVNVFVERPRLAAYDAVNVPVLLKATPFSAEVVADEWIHVFVSDGELVVDQQAAQLLNGRLFVDVIKSGARVSFTSSSPGLVSLSGEVELLRRAARFVKPVQATAEITQAFLSSVLGSVNPLLDKSVAVGGGSVGLEFRPRNNIISLDKRRPVDMEVSIGAYSTKIRQGELIKDVLKILNLSNQRDLVIESGPARVLVSIDAGGMRQHVETVIERVSLIFSDSRRVDVGLSTTLDGSPAEFASGAATLEMAIDIHPSTLRDVMKIRSKQPLRVDVCGVMAKPKVMAKDALVRLGVLLVDGMLA